MKLIIDYIGLTESFISEKILLPEPIEKEEFFISDSAFVDDISVQELMDYIRDNIFDNDTKGKICHQFNFSYKEIYIEVDDYYYKFEKNINLSMVKNILKDIVFHIVIYIGGASIHYDGYRFVVHSNEDIHKYLPHVHVEKSGYSIRYRLDNQQAIDDKNIPREFIRDKKMIENFIKMNKDKLLGFWNASQNGFVTPVLTENGEQELN